MKLVLIVLGVVVGLVVLITIIGAFMPRAHVATSEITLKQPIDKVYATVRDVGGMKNWWTELKTSERVQGAARERYRQEAGGFKMELEIGEDTPPTGFTTHIVTDERASFGGKWVWRLTPTQGGTIVAVSEDGWIGPPPFRVMATVMGLHRTLDGVLTALGKHFGEQVTPSHR